MKNPLLALAVLLLCGCATNRPPPKPSGYATLWGYDGGFSILTDKSSNVFIVEVDGRAQEGWPALPTYLPPGKHMIGFWAASKYHRSEIIRFDFEAAADAVYRFKALSGGQVIKLAFGEEVGGSLKEQKGWALPTVYQRGQGATLPIFIPAK